MEMINYYRKALDFVLAKEGGFVDDPVDRGGATNKGITQKVYDNFRLSYYPDIRSIKLITDEEIEKIYSINYWLAGKCDILPFELKIVHFDTCVNCGVKQATKFLQRSVGVEADGVIGDKTLNAIKAIENLFILVSGYINQRLDFYDNLVVRNPSQVKFLKGWKNRISDLSKLVEKEFNQRMLFCDVIKDSVK
jgi:lysozyme family protein